MLSVKSKDKTHILCEEVQYSSTEAVYTGRKWIDGNKIYSIAIKSDVPDVSTATDLLYGLPDSAVSMIDRVISLSALWHISNQYINIPRPHKNNEHDGISLDFDSNKKIHLGWGEKNSGGEHFHHHGIYRIGINLNMKEVPLDVNFDCKI